MALAAANVIFLQRKSSVISGIDVISVWRGVKAAAWQTILYGGGVAS